MSKKYNKSAIENEINYRRKKLIELRQDNKIAFPNDFSRNFTSEELHKKFSNSSNIQLKKIDVVIKIAGRMMSKRIMGKASFITLQDNMGGKIQLYVTNNNLSDKNYNKFKTWDIGDILGASGKLFKTKTGELSIYCSKIKILVKSLKPIPDKFYGLSDKEICYRKRYLDLIINNKSRKIFQLRSVIINEIRNFMIKNNFLEVETPMLHKIPGGATAKPFATHHNNLNTNMYLRISPELYLKRLVIGGFEKIFEINRNFRNEGISTYHNPEFTMMELYIAYSNYKELMKFIENLFLHVVLNVLEKKTIFFKNKKINFEKPFRVLTIKQSILKYISEIKEIELNNYKKIVKIANSLNVIINKNWSIDRISLEIFEKKVKQLLLKPTFITEYPIEVSTLARRNDHNPEKIADRFELFIGGMEIGNGFSELNDVDDQLKRFIKQTNKNEYDSEYISALKYGLPPTAGLGIGIDRMIMILTNSSSIRDVILFPTLKTKKN